MYGLQGCTCGLCHGHVRGCGGTHHAPGRGAGPSQGACAGLTCPAPALYPCPDASHPLAPCYDPSHLQAALSNTAPETRFMSSVCWVMVNMVTKVLNLYVGTKFQAAQRGPDYGGGDNRLEVQGYVSLANDACGHRSTLKALHLLHIDSSS